MARFDIHTRFPFTKQTIKGSKQCQWSISYVVTFIHQLKLEKTNIEVQQILSLLEIYTTKTRRQKECQKLNTHYSHASKTQKHNMHCLIRTNHIDSLDMETGSETVYTIKQAKPNQEMQNIRENDIKSRIHKHNQKQN